MNNITIDDISKLLEDKLDKKVSITMETNIKKQSGLDSLDLVEFIMLIEDTYDIEISDAQIEHFKTFGDLLFYLNSRCNAK